MKKDGDNLKADVAYPDNKTFSNTYTAPQPAKAKISASKILEGAELKNGEFNFNCWMKPEKFFKQNKMLQMVR